MVESVVSRVIIEMVGAPKEHLEKTINAYILSLEKQEGIKILKRSVADAIPQGNLFSSFIELEARFDTPEYLISFCFDAMPSSVEIFSPETINFSALELTNFLNDLQARLHTTDMQFKMLSAQSKVLDSNALHVFHNFLIHLIREGKKTVKELSPFVGIGETDLKEFLDRLIEKKILSVKSGVYEVI